MSINDVNINSIKIIREACEKILKLMKVDFSLEVSEDKESEAILVNIDTPKDSGLIIGSRGRTLNSLQLILGLILKNKLSEWKRVIIDISGWRNKEKERLENLARQTSQRAIDSGEPQYLYNLTSSQRRIVHLYLASNKNIKTESQGEGKDRFLVVTSIN